MGSRSQGACGVGTEGPRDDSGWVWCLLGRGSWAFIRNKRKMEERPGFLGFVVCFLSGAEDRLQDMRHAQSALTTELHPSPSLGTLESRTEQGASPWRCRRQHLDPGLQMLWTRLASVAVCTVSGVSVGGGWAWRRTSE